MQGAAQTLGVATLQGTGAQAQQHSAAHQGTQNPLVASSDTHTQRFTSKFLKVDPSRKGARLMGSAVPWLG